MDVDGQRVKGAGADASPGRSSSRKVGSFSTRPDALRRREPNPLRRTSYLQASALQAVSSVKQLDATQVRQAVLLGSIHPERHLLETQPKKAPQAFWAGVQPLAEQV